MGFETIIGLIATIASVLGYIPQVVKSWRTRQVEDVSISMVLLLLFSLSSWLVYGFLVSDLHLIVTNIISLNLLFLLLAAKLKFGGEKAEEKEISSDLISFPSQQSERSERSALLESGVLSHESSHSTLLNPEAKAMMSEELEPYGPLTSFGPKLLMEIYRRENTVRSETDERSLSLGESFK